MKGQSSAHGRYASFSSVTRSKITQPSGFRDAGFDLRTEDKQGEQFGFSIADDQIKGHIDGVICAGPVQMGYPALWENKSANDKKFQAFVRHGVAKANPTYATQIALYQTYMELSENPALFTVVNKNTSEVYYELVPYDQELAQKASDKAVNILTASKAGDICQESHKAKTSFFVSSASIGRLAGKVNKKKGPVLELAPPRSVLWV